MASFMTFFFSFLTSSLLIEVVRHQFVFDAYIQWFTFVSGPQRKKQNELFQASFITASENVCTAKGYFK